MDELEGRRLRRLRSARPETAESVLPEVPRVGALDALLREVDGLRLTLETDLTLAASAVEAGAPQVALDIIDSDREALTGFEKRALGQVAELSAPHRRWRVPAAPFVAAAAVAGFLIGVVPHTTSPTEPSLTSSSLEAPTESLSRLVEATQTGQTDEALSASQDLHAQLRVLVANAKSDPQAAANALVLLQQERNLLAFSADSVTIDHLLAENKRLMTLLASALPPTIAAKVAPSATLPPVIAAPTAKPTQSPSSKPTTKATAKPTSSPKPASTPSSKPSSSPSSGDGPLPPAPGFH